MHAPKEAPGRRQTCQGRKGLREVQRRRSCTGRLRLAQKRDAAGQRACIVHVLPAHGVKASHPGQINASIGASAESIAAEMRHVHMEARGDCLDNELRQQEGRHQGQHQG